MLCVCLPAKTFVLFSRDDQSSLAALDLRWEIIASAGIESSVLFVGMCGCRAFVTNSCALFHIHSKRLILFFRFE